MHVAENFKHLGIRARFVVVAWLLLLCSFYTFSTFYAGSTLLENKISSAERHSARLSQDRVEEGKTGFDKSLLNEEYSLNASKVEVGIYLDRVVNLSTKATDWTVDFYIWFRWSDKRLNPGESFQVIGGEILSKNEIVPKSSNKSSNENYYTLYRVTARITKFFNIMRYPLDNHMLTIHIEEEKYPWQQFQYQPDITNSKLSSRVKIPGYKIIGAPHMVAKPHAYKSNRGNPNNSGVTYSQLIYGLEIQRPDWGLYFKMFQGLFASVAIAFLAFLFHPTSGERIRLGVGAFFASVASSYVNLAQLPGVSMVTMTDMMNGIAMVTIFLSIWASVISARLATNERYIEASKALDIVMLVIFITGFVSTNVAIALCASTI